MLKIQPDRQLPEPEAFVVVWTSNNRVRCVLAPLEDSLELRLEYDGDVIRRGRYVDARSACEAGRRWRADWEHRDELGPHLRVAVACPECGDDALAERDSLSGAQWLRCRSCGEAWITEKPGSA
jgi:hypothetical protein